MTAADSRRLCLHIACRMFLATGLHQKKASRKYEIRNKESLSLKNPRLATAGENTASCAARVKSGKQPHAIKGFAKADGIRVSNPRRAARCHHIGETGNTLPTAWPGDVNCALETICVSHDRI